MSQYKDETSKSKGEYSPLTPHGDTERHLADIPHQRTSRWSNMSTYLHLALETVIMILLCGLLWTSINGRESHLGTDKRVSSGPFNQKRQFGHNDKYASFSHKQDNLWEEFIREDFGDLQFPPYNSSGQSIDHIYDAGSISMFHSLHCLAGMRRAFQNMAEGKLSMLVLQNDPHVPHCFDYLRQSILCFADDTFELARDSHGVPDGIITEGAYDVHTCRDPSKLFDLTHRYGEGFRKAPWPS